MHNLSLFFCGLFVICIRICLCVRVLVVYRRLLGLLWMIFMQVASTEWFLGVQIQDFVNIHNVIIVQGGYCCCKFIACSQNIADLQGICMTHFCLPYFLIRIKDSSCNGIGSLDKTYQLNYEPSTSVLDRAALSIPFKQMDTCDYVRVKIS